jgi:acetyl-CoA carboxylase biotin carboxyl carrier protein
MPARLLHRSSAIIGPPMATLDVRCEVAGKVVRIEARAGARVAAEDTLLVIECMKMEIPVPAPAAGLLEALHVAEGDAVEQDQHVATLRS